MGENTIDGGSAGAHLQNLAGWIGFDVDCGACALLVGHAGFGAKIVRGLTGIECDGLGSAAADGPVAPAAAKAAIAIEQQPPLGSYNPCHATSVGFELEAMSR